MLKKFSIAIMAFLILFMFGACARAGEQYNDADIKTRIEALENKNNDLSKQLEAINNPTTRIYTFGESATVVLNGIKLLTIKYADKDPAIETAYFEITNHSLVSMNANNYLSITQFDINTGAHTTVGGGGVQVDINKTERIITSYSGMYGYIQFGLPTAGGRLIPYAIFQLR